MALKSSMKIIMVDEQPGNRQVLKKMLTNLGFKNIIEAGDGPIALKKIIETAKDDPIRLVITELDLPGFDGIQLVQKLKQDEEIPKCGILGITNDPNQEKLLSAIQSGVHAVMVRPFSANTLIEKIGKIFKQ